MTGDVARKIVFQLMSVDRTMGSYALQAKEMNETSFKRRC